MDHIEVKFAADQVNEATGEFSGYGAVFGNIDSHGDVIAPSAFRDTLDAWSKRGALPPMKLMHGTAINPFSGSDRPIGVWKSMREDSNGLHVSGVLSGMDTDIGRFNRAQVKDGALGGLSIGYRAVKVGKPMAGSPAKRILEAVHLAEVSLVDTPSNDRARVDAVKAAAEIKTIREFEDFLRDVGGYSRAAAKAIAAGGFKASDPRDEDGADLAAIVRSNIAKLQPKEI